MSIVPGDNYSMTHPSLFQTPAADAALLADMTSAKQQHPEQFWTIPVTKTAANGTVGPSYPFDPRDPPFTAEEKADIVRKLKPVVYETTTNSMPTLLYYFFFSEENVATLQKNIRYAVNKWSGYNVGDSSIQELVLLMEQIFASHARHVDEHSAPSSILMRHIRNQLTRLNELVVNAAAPVIINGAEQHVGYLKRVDNPVTAGSLQRPVDTRVTGTKVYRSFTDVMARQ